MNFDVAIIGGGITGLTLAHKIGRHFPRRVIFESGKVGGLIQSTKIKGFTLEHGANTLVLSPHTASLLEDLGLTEAATAPALYPFQQYVYYNDAITPVPRGPLALLRSSLFTWKEKLQIVRGISRKTSAPLDAHTIEGLFTSLLGNALVSRVVNPALRGIYGGTVASLNAKAVFPKIVEHLEGGGSLFGYARHAARSPRKIFHLRGGNSRLVDALVASIGADRILNDHVERIEPIADGFEIATVSGAVHTARQCVVTTAGHATGRLVQSLDEHCAQDLHAMRFAPVATVHVSIPDTTPLPEKAFGVLFPSSSPVKIIGVLFNSLLFPHTAPIGKHLLTVCIGGVGTAAQKDEAELATTALAELSTIFGIHDAEVLAVHNWSHAIPQYEATIHAIQRQLDALERRHPGLYFIGADRPGVGVPERIRWAMEASPRLLRHVQRQGLLQDGLSAR